MTSDSAGLTVKELVLRVEGKIDGFIAVHEARHIAEAVADQTARGDASSTPAGRELARAITDVTIDVDHLTKTVDKHDRLIQRMIGALTLVTTLGIGTLALVLGRIAGIVP